MQNPDVLVVGAGPTGLALALWLSKLGVRTRIIDRTAQAGTTSRALAVQARTLELYRQVDLAEAVVQRSHRAPAVNLWARGVRAARLAFETIGERLTPYPYLHIFPQDEHERVLIERLQRLGVSVERRTELLSFSDDGDRVSTRLRRADGAEVRCESRYLAGCDGARSLVREALATGFAGGTYAQVFYVADIEGTGPPLDGELHVDLDEADFLAVFPLAGSGRGRLVGAVRGDRAQNSDGLRFEDVSSRAIRNLRLGVDRVNWFSTYHVHHRVAGHFSRGRVFLLGDAAHLHSPVGGQGMNTGIGDAVNLAWKLAAVLGGQADADLLATYEPERMAFARRLVATTDRVFTLVTAEGRIADLVRTRIAPLVLSSALALGPVRDFFFRTVSQLEVNYRGLPLSTGRAGAVHGGDRLPWIGAGQQPGSAADNHAPLTAMRWQVQVCGAASQALREACAGSGLPLSVFPWSAACGPAGLERDALYVIRPDTYIALAQREPDPAALERYFLARRLRPRAPGAPPRGRLAVDAAHS